LIGNGVTPEADAGLLAAVDADDAEADPPRTPALETVLLAVLLEFSYAPTAKNTTTTAAMATTTATIQGHRLDPLGGRASGGCG
jgi:hypothetical protein